jgi:adenosylhomocysteine nucleosidase
MAPSLEKERSLAARAGRCGGVGGLGDALDDRSPLFEPKSMLEAVGPVKTLGPVKTWGRERARPVYCPLEMERQTEAPIAVLAALREELSLLERVLGRRRRGRGESEAAGEVAGRPVLLARTGMGARAARAAADRLIRSSRPRAILAVGFAGGLTAEAAAGDLILASEIYEPPPPEGDGPRQWPADPELLAAARSLRVEGLNVREGRIAASRAFLATSGSKREFGLRHRALAVDMESSGIARAANVHDVPVLYLRVVLDEVGYDWPLDFGPLLTPEGTVRPLRLLGALLRRPRALQGLAELRDRTRGGARTLARYVPLLAASLPAPRPAPS